MSQITSKILAVASALVWGTPPSPFTLVQSQVFGAAGNFILPAGDWWVESNAAITVSNNPSGDGVTWVTISAVSQLVFVRSDGFTVRINASAATTANYFGPA